ncbi:hypothetical protein HDU85_001730 [Gaertneriomyces sp. JEL0708]|nr:hypothetical protein HDU85_001730 [Gaertneriomyces sp. JEL0708]
MCPQEVRPCGALGRTALKNKEKPVLSHTFELKSISTKKQYTEWKAFSNGPGGLVRLSYAWDETDTVLRLSLSHTRPMMYRAVVMELFDSEGKMVYSKTSRGKFVDTSDRLKLFRHGEFSQWSGLFKVRFTFDRPEEVLEKWNEEHLWPSPFGTLLGDSTLADVHLSLQSESMPLVEIASSTTNVESELTMGSETLKKIVKGQADNQVFTPAVQGVLGAQSTYFKTMFSGTFKEGARTTEPSKLAIKGPFHPEDIPAVLAHYMSYMYTGKTCADIDINGRIRAQLFSLAHLTCMSRFCVDLARAIMQASDITLQNLCGWLRFAHLYANTGGTDESHAAHLLMLYAMRKFLEWRADIIDTDEFRRLVADPECESLKNDLLVNALLL